MNVVRIRESEVGGARVTCQSYPGDRVLRPYCWHIRRRGRGPRAPPNKNAGESYSVVSILGHQSRDSTKLIWKRKLMLNRQVMVRVIASVQIQVQSPETQWYSVLNCPPFVRSLLLMLDVHSQIYIPLATVLAVWQRSNTLSVQIQLQW